MDERTKAAFDVAQDTIKQLITIAAAIVGAVVTLSGPGPSAVFDTETGGWALTLAISLLCLSVASGVAALLNLIGALGSPAIRNPTPYRPAIRLFVAAQIILFGIGIIVFGTSVPLWGWLHHGSPPHAASITQPKQQP